jgi:hypothetical protein
MKQATLSTNAKDAYLAGPAILDLQENKLSMDTTTPSLLSKSITIVPAGEDEQTFTEGGVYDFYFILPAGSYVGDTGYENKGLTFQINNGTASTDATHILAADLENVTTNTLVTKTLYYTSDGAIVTGVIAQLNNRLAKVTKDSPSATVDLKGDKTGGTIYVPVADTEEDQLETLTITMENVGTGALTIQPLKAGYAPKTVVIKTSNHETTADQSTTTDAADITIKLPESRVELAPEASKVTLAKVASSTAKDVMLVKAGVTINALTVNAGNVYVEKEASVTSSSSMTCYIFDEAVDRTTTEDTNVTRTTKDVYHLLYPQDGDEITLPAGGFKIKSAIEVTANKDVTLDLYGRKLTAESSVGKINILKVSGQKAKLTIVDTSDKKNGQITSSKSNTVIVVENGGEVVFSAGAGTIVSTNTSASVVTVDNGTFSLNGGSVSANASSTGYAISVDNAGTVTINSEAGTAEDADTKTVNGNISVTKGTGTTGSTLNLQKGVIAGNITVTGSTLDITGGSVAGNTGAATIAASTDAIVNIANATITGGTSADTDYLLSLATGSSATISGTSNLTHEKTVASVNASTLKLENGTIKSTGAVAIAAEGTNSTITIENGSVTSTTKEAITGNATAVAISGGTVSSDAEAAIFVKGGSLTISGGKVSASAESKQAIKDDANAATISISAGEVTSDKDEAIKLIAGSELTVTGGAITGKTVAVDITSGTLSVPSGSPTLKGEVVISAVPADKATVEVTLAAAGATYTSTEVNGEWAIYNSTYADGKAGDTAASAALLSITAGTFNGDIISDAKKYFIEGGYFKNCSNMEENSEDYFGTTKTYGKSDKAGYWTAVDKTRSVKK